MTRDDLMERYGSINSIRNNQIFIEKPDYSQLTGREGKKTRPECPIFAKDSS